MSCGWEVWVSSPGCRVGAQRWRADALDYLEEDVAVMRAELDELKRRDTGEYIARGEDAQTARCP